MFHHVSRLRCENCFETKRAAGGPLLCGDPEQALDEHRLPHHILSANPFQLTLPHHVHGIDSLRRPLGGVEGAVALCCPPIST